MRAASLTRQMEVEVTFVWRRPHPSRQQRIIFDIVCTLPRHLLQPEKVFVCSKSVEKMLSLGVAKLPHSRIPSPVGSEAAARE